MKRSFWFILCMIICLLFANTSFADESTPVKWGTSTTYYHRYHSVTVSHDLSFNPALIFRTDYPRITLPSENPVSCTSPGWITYVDHEIHSFNTPTGGYNCYQYINYYMEPINHAGTVFTVSREATCSSNAEESGSCRYCQQTVTREVPDSAADHLYETYVPFTPADCTNPAVEIAYCEFSCGASHQRTVGQAVPDAHLWSDWTPLENATHTRTCSVNAEHTQTEACQSELYCSDCGRSEDFAFTAGRVDIKTYDRLALEIALTQTNQTVSSQSVTFTSLQPGIVAVSEDGAVTGLSAGEAVIVAALPSGISAQCTVCVAARNEFDLPDSLIAIEAEALAGTKAEAVILPDGCTRIGDRAFAGAEELIVYMPDSVSDIADGAFAGCQSVYLICESENTAAAYAAGKHIPYRIEKLK